MKQFYNFCLLILLCGDGTSLTKVINKSKILNNAKILKMCLYFLFCKQCISFLPSRFLSSVVQSLGLVGSEAVRNINIDTLPVLIILMRSRSTTEIFTIVHGNVGVNELLTNLIHAVDVFQVRYFYTNEFLYGKRKIKIIYLSISFRNKNE